MCLRFRNTIIMYVYIQCYGIHLSIGIYIIYIHNEGVIFYHALSYFNFIYIKNMLIIIQFKYFIYVIDLYDV